MKVKTSYTSCEYITAGKIYHVEQDGVDEIIIDDDGDTIYIMGPSYSACPHLNDEGHWEEVQ
ncbi:MAG: hypothetical protein Tp118SUR00d2C21406351_50 [Prokaryotic dsDNA virus sp.]|nr:MAG: hypothetical protein Tp118SUR00d2C21406351_50 [Prokaryotic dsDNA virus sp.]